MKIRFICLTLSVGTMAIIPILSLTNCKNKDKNEEMLKLISVTMQGPSYG
jgi:hypothetical protein